jgi:hypothetical protein
MHLEFSSGSNLLIPHVTVAAMRLHRSFVLEALTMIVMCIAHPEQAAEVAERLAGICWDEIYQEKIAEDETLMSVRASTVMEAAHLTGLLYRAGAYQIEIDAEAA